MKKMQCILSTHFSFIGIDGKSLCATSENVQLQRWVEPGEEMLQINPVIEK